VAGSKTKTLAAGAEALPKPTAKALEIARKKSLAEVREIYQPGAAPDLGSIFKGIKKLFGSAPR
jgi:hypothetical protein